MKKFVGGLFALTTAAVLTTGQAGPVEWTYQQQPHTAYRTSEDWFRDREWNFDLFGSYAFIARPYRSDRYLGVDHAWGGGIDLNYVFNRYLGVGIQGYGLAADDAIGQASGNLILRYPIPGTRVAPYAYAGGGVIFNGSDVDDLVIGASVVSTRITMPKAWVNSGPDSNSASRRTSA